MLAATPRRSRSIRLTCLLALAALGACDASTLGEAPPLRCVEVAAQCQLEKGPLGVCERAACAPGETPPCFQCTPQH